jgi:signal transduction histidine kinase
MAVSELVKNAYDADASQVVVRLISIADGAGGCIEIRDDGSGMSLDTLLEAWLQPATSYKLKGGRKVRTGRGRYPLGEKGVGRFAVDKLGAELELLTRAEGSRDEVKLAVAWDRFVDREYLDEIENTWEVRAPVEFEGPDHGTLLRIRSLRTSWDLPLLQRVQEGLARLISPSRDGNEFEVILDVPEFSALSGPIRSGLLEAAPYRLQGHVTENGLLQIRDEGVAMLDLRESAGDQFRTHRGRGLRRPTCGPFDISLSVWDLDVLGLARLSRPLRAQLRQSSGVSIYRDGFRVAPYGDRGDDWLELNQRRVNNPTMRVSTNQIVGIVEITQETNPELRDRTSREGLIDKPAFRDLAALVLAALSILEEQRYARRKAAALPAPEPGSDPVMTWLERARRDGSRGPALKSAIDTYRQYRREAERRELVLLRVASAGAAAETLLGQLNGSVAALARQLPLLGSKVGSHGPVERLSSQLHLVARQLDALQRIRSGANPQLSRVDLRGVAQDVATVYGPALDSMSVELAITGPAGVIVRTDRSMLLQALLHVVENAILAAAEMSQHRWVEIEVQSEPAGVVVRDSGYGVPTERQDLIFDPFFTTRPGSDGLGLYFARTLLQTVGCDLRLSNAGDEFRLVF